MVPIPDAYKCKIKDFPNDTTIVIQLNFNQVLENGNLLTIYHFCFKTYFACYSGTTGYEVAHEWYQRLRVCKIKMAIFPRYGVETSEENQHTLLTTFIQLDGHTCLLYTKIRRFSTHYSTASSTHLSYTQCHSFEYILQTALIHLWASYYESTCSMTSREYYIHCILTTWVTEGLHFSAFIMSVYT